MALGGAGERTLLLVTAQQLHAQGDALVPGPGDDPYKAGEERRLKDVLLVGVVVDVASEHLGTKRGNRSQRSGDKIQPEEPWILSRF